MSLNFYLQDAAALLHDQSYSFTSKAQLTRWVNLGRRECARRAGCIERLVTGQSAFGASAQPGAIIPGAMQPGSLPGAAPGASANASTNSFMTIPGVERYPYQGFANPYVANANAGVKAISDVIQVSASWGGSVRPALDWKPFDELQAYARAYATLVTSYPYYWSTLNDGENGEVWLFPVPSFAMEMEWLTFCVPTDLTSDNDYDAIPEGFRNSIKWYAAGMAFMTSQRPETAAIHFNAFADSLGVSRFAADSGKVGSYYPVSVGP